MTAPQPVVLLVSDRSSRRLLLQNVSIIFQMSRTIFLDPLRFHLEVKENPKGRFLKIADVSPDGKKNQISMTFAAANVFSENLVKMIDFYDSLHQLNRDQMKTRRTEGRGDVSGRYRISHGSPGEC